MKKSTITINPKTAWLMGVDPVATGVRLQNKRTEFSLTREGLLGLLEEAGEPVSTQAIYKWEKGKSLPTLSRLVVLACLYNCSLDELVVTYQRSRESAERDQPLSLHYNYNIYMIIERTFKRRNVRFFICKNVPKHILCVYKPVVGGSPAFFILE